MLPLSSEKLPAQSGLEGLRRIRLWGLAVPQGSTNAIGIEFGYNYSGCFHGRHTASTCSRVRMPTEPYVSPKAPSAA